MHFTIDLRLQPLLALLLVLLASCSAAEAPQPSPEPAAPATLSPTPQTAPAYPAPSPPPAAPTVAAPAEAAPAPAVGGRVVIGVQGPASGPAAARGVGLHNAAAIAALQLARPLSDLGYSLELRPLDDQNQPEQARSNAEQLAADPDALCVVGHVASSATRAALQVYGESELALVVPASAGIGITGDGYNNSLRLIGRDDVQATIAARFARESLKAERAFVVQEPSDYGEVLANGFKSRAAASGPRVVGEALIDEANLLAALREARPDIVYLAAGYQSAGPLIRSLRAAGIDTALIGPDGLDTPELPQLVGQELGDLYYTTLTAPVTELPYAAQFASDYEARHLASAPPFAAQAYDAVALCVEAIARAAEKAGRRPSRSEVRAALRGIGGYEGIAGSYRFDANGELVEAPYYVLQAQGSSWAANPVIVTVSAPPPRP